MKYNKTLFIFCILLTTLLSCDSEVVENTANIQISVTQNGIPMRGIHVCMFDSNHSTTSSFFTPFFADDEAVTDLDGNVNFEVEFFDDSEIFYFGVFDGDNCIGSTSVSVTADEIKYGIIEIGDGHRGGYRLQEIITENVITVHSLNYSGDANNRSFLPIQLPPNTVKWFYSVSSNFARPQNETLDLLSDLSRYLDPTNGILADIINSLDAPTGTADFNVYFIKDNENLDIFNNKSGNFLYYPEGSRKNINSGVVDVEVSTENPTTWYLGIENPDSNDDIYVLIEVCALVYEEE
jgi:hypothetical protein